MAVLKGEVRTMDIYPIFGWTYKYAQVLCMENLGKIFNEPYHSNLHNRQTQQIHLSDMD